MNYNKNLTDYLNQEGDNYKVIHFRETGNEVFISYKADDDSYLRDTTITLLDLIVFLYSKL